MPELADATARLHSVEDIMERLNLGRSKVYELLGSRQLRSIKVGRRRLVSGAQLIDFINRLEAGEVALTDDPRAPEHPEPNKATRMGDAVSVRQPRAPASTLHD